MKRRDFVRNTALASAGFAIYHQEVYSPIKFDWELSVPDFVDRIISTMP
jgi:hypothetical protein